jgi:hypothetical protein
LLISSLMLKRQIEAVKLVLETKKLSADMVLVGWENFILNKEKELVNEPLPAIILVDQERAATVYCDSELYQVLTDMLNEENQDSELSLVKLGKMYLKFKHVLKNIKRG